MSLQCGLTRLRLLLRFRKRLLVARKLHARRDPRALSQTVSQRNNPTVENRVEVRRAEIDPVVGIQEPTGPQLHQPLKRLLDPVIEGTVDGVSRLFFPVY